MTQTSGEESLGELMRNASEDEGCGECGDEDFTGGGEPSPFKWVVIALAILAVILVIIYLKKAKSNKGKDTYFGYKRSGRISAY